MFLDTRNKNMYGLGVSILTVFMILVHLLLNGERITSYGIHYQMLLDTMNKDMYGPGMEISTTFETFSNFSFLTGGLTLGPYLMYCIYFL
jgi:hypothetical protein